MMPDIEVSLIGAIDEEIEQLLQQSRDYMSALYPAESIHQEASARLLAPNLYFIGAYSNRKLAGLGAVKILRPALGPASAYGEIKNLFVDPRYRGQGISRLIMQALEQHLCDQLIDRVRLETGISQPESIALYQSLGYQACAAFGDYQPDPLSLFMEKQLAACT